MEFRTGAGVAANAMNAVMVRVVNTSGELELRRHQYGHLARLAWDLHLVGVRSAVEVGPELVPVVRIARASGPVRVMAWDLDGIWVFTWGHSRNQRIEVSDARAVSRIAGLAR